jgi:Tn3 transposase DDE domain
VRAYDLIRALGRSGNPTPLGTAFAEYGRISKTQHLLAVCDPDDDAYRRGINAQQNQTESRHRLARKLFFGQRGELRQRYQEGMEDQLGALGLVLNACVLWTTTYLDAAIRQLREQGYPVRDEDAVRLSPSGTPSAPSTPPPAMAPCGRRWLFEPCVLRLGDAVQQRHCGQHDQCRQGQPAQHGHVVAEVGVGR